MSNILFFSLVDTVAERTSFIEKVYPELRTFCRQFGFEIQIHDLHWGLRNESTEDHSLPNMCLNYLQKCQASPCGGIVLVSKQLILLRFLYI